MTGPDRSPGTQLHGARAMTDQGPLARLSRRDVLKAAGLTALAAGGAGIAPRLLGTVVAPSAVKAADPLPNLALIGTDGWISLPASPPIGAFHPDNLAPPPYTTYIFGFRNATGMTPAQVTNQKNHAQHSAPLFWAQEGVEFRVQLTNIGLAQRPDLFDAHTVHWHGFRNVIPLYDGEPTGSVAVPAGQTFTYVYRPHDPGTYMYHCHVEDVEHVHMGMNGLVFIRPAQDGTAIVHQSRTYTKFAYNCGDGSTGFDREYAMHLSEVWAESHWADAHIQLPEWSDYRADFALLNGRTYPDTLAPNGSIDPFHPVRDADGDLVPVSGYEHLKYQPLSSVVTAQAGERVLLRFANLGFKEASMRLHGIRMHVIGRDATLLRGRDGSDASYWTDTVLIGAGESFDALFTAPPHSGGSGPDVYVLADRASAHAGPAGDGQRTEVRVYPTGSLAAQQYPNDPGI